MNKELKVAELAAAKLRSHNVIQPNLRINGWKLYVSDVAMNQLSPANDVVYHVATGTIWCRTTVGIEDILPTLNALGYHSSVNISSAQ